MNLEYVLFTILGMGISGLLWFFKNAISAWLTSSIRHDYDKKLEGIKSKLTSIENEEVIRLERLADKQLEVMLDLYERFAELYGSIQFYCGPMDWDKLATDTKFITLYEDICKFQKAFNRSKVFLTESLEKDFVELIGVARRIKIVYRLITNKDSTSKVKENLTEKSEIDMIFIDKKLPEIRDSIEKEYRRIWHVRS